MNARAWGVLGVALVVLSGGHGAAQPIPVQAVTVPFETAAFLSLATGDVTGYAFVLIEMPSNGILIGIPPHLVYIPSQGFLGTDWVAFAATSPEGVLHLGTVKILVLGRGEEMAMPVLLGDGELVFSGPAFATDRYRFAVGLQQRFRYFEQSLRATWTDVGFVSWVGTTRVELEGSVPSQWRLPITSTMTFDPTIPGLSSWVVDARTTLLGATWISTFFYSGTDPQTGSYISLQAQGTVGAFEFDALTEFVTLTPTFGRLRLNLRGPWICERCPTKWELGFLQTKAGFEHLTFLIKDVEIPCPVCVGIQILFDTKVTFTVHEKRIEPALRIGSGFVGCVRPYVALPTPSDPFGFTGIELYGMEVRCDTVGGYSLRLATSFNPTKDSAVTGDGRFFELWQLEGPVVPCCGNPGRFQITAYFKRETNGLFGLGMVNAVVFFPLSRELLVNVGLKTGEVEPAPSTKTWVLTVGWRGIW